MRGFTRGCAVRVVKLESPIIIFLTLPVYTSDDCMDYGPKITTQVLHADSPNNVLATFAGVPDKIKDYKNSTEV